MGTKQPVESFRRPTLPRVAHDFPTAFFPTDAETMQTAAQE